ncbi:MAG: heavy metal translocating P-type ATPase [Ancalomicrobiaceae bacterium]|nr:heavy metal translocating P-type ATPase [Ancalomicrobiaceae bacterium]
MTQAMKTPTEPIVLDLTGMTCAACAARIEKVLRRAPGVESATVNLALESAEVAAPDASPANLIAVVEGAGYGARLRSRDPKARRHESEAREAERRRELRQAFAVFLISALLTVPFLVVMAAMAMGHHVHGFTPEIQLALATPVQIVAGWRFYVGAFKSIRGGSANMDVLVALGTSAAYGFSLYQMIELGQAAEGHLYFEGAATILTLVMLGKLLEARARRSASSAIARLMELSPPVATRLGPAGAVEVPVEDLRLGDRVLVRPGERVAVDGVVRDGASELDESLVTGESQPVAKHVGDAVVAGTINGAGAIEIEVKAVGDDTTLARIGRLVEQAQIAKAPVQRLVDRIAGIFVPTVLVIAALTFAAWMLAGAGLEAALIAAVSVTVIACPCALGLATPTALVAGTGAAARAGILIRDIEALERAHAVDTVIFDKTGTLTLGKPVVTDVFTVGPGARDMLRLAAAVQASSEHPLARAMVAAAELDGGALPVSGMAHALPGRGVEAMVEGRAVAIGNEALMRDKGVDLAFFTEEADKRAAEGKTVVFVAKAGEALGLIALTDPIRPEARAAVAILHRAGIDARMATGDRGDVAERIGRELGLDRVAGPLRPEEKAALVRALSAEGRTVAMVGDGVNDAPALAAADIGIAMGSGTDVAMETAGITLMRPDPRLVAASLDIARATWGKIRQNLVLAFVYNVVGIPLAAFGLMTPALAGAAMALSSVSVVTNALTLTRWRPRNLM